MVNLAISRTALKEGSYNSSNDNNLKYNSNYTYCNSITPAVISLIAELMQEEYRIDNNVR